MTRQITQVDSSMCPNMDKVSPTGTLNIGVHESIFFFAKQTQAREIEVHKYEIYPTGQNLSAITSQT